MRRLRGRAAALVLIAVAGCLDREPFGSTGPDAAGIAVTPATLFLEPGSIAGLSA
jgi:hypothetical protein